jgi:hypothetical protein
VKRLKKAEKDFRNMVVMNYGYVYSDTMDKEPLELKKELTNDKWFDYVVSDEVAESLKGVLDSKNIDKDRFKKIVNDDVLNSRSVIFSSLNEKKAVNHAKKMSEKTLVIKLQQ